MDKEGWRVVTNMYQQFYEHWRNSSTGFDFLDTFPYKLSLGVDSDGSDDRYLLPVTSRGAPGNRIVFTRSYGDMFHRPLRLRKDDEGDAKGAVLTGQPGNGAPL
jgi:hypothetical protein